LKLHENITFSVPLNKFQNWNKTRKLEQLEQAKFTNHFFHTRKTGTLEQLDYPYLYVKLQSVGAYQLQSIRTPCTNRPSWETGWRRKTRQHPLPTRTRQDAAPVL